MTITVQGANLMDVRMKLGIRRAEVEIELHGDPYRPEFHAYAFGNRQKFMSVSQAINFVRAALLLHIHKVQVERQDLRRKLAEKNKSKKRTRG